MPPALWCQALLVADLLHRWRLLLSCCSATGSSSTTAPVSSILIMLSVHCYHAALLPVVAALLHQCRPFLSCCSATGINSSSVTARCRPLL
ncbi:hypothetical protein PR003_g18781 [Phytophthora rubi]|uniref:Uncharacterized protein n=1 Tax=Phytophthora rubi TaxID=129364 RepID=A0A6A3KAR3_9STRA|nr:hypothetical protein PR002_g17909 [Phytophthora rubi]KAE9001765.1 hypothetical protein PR001_g18439 [Phytophthora rubi]KAE9316219.1 hypothetical protein PR003_g18781 [Phytophthora rubi]